MQAVSVYLALLLCCGVSGSPAFSGVPDGVPCHCFTARAKRGECELLRLDFGVSLGVAASNGAATSVLHLLMSSTGDTFSADADTLGLLLPKGSAPKRRTPFLP